MATEYSIKKLLDSQEFRQLIRKRLRVCLVLSAIMIIYYTAFYLCMAFLPGFMAATFSDSSVISIGIYFGISSMLLAVILSGYYTWWSSNKFDPVKKEIMKKLLDEKDP